MSLSANQSRVRTRQIGPSARSEVQPWVAPQGKPSDKAIGPICPFPEGLTPMRRLLCRPARAWSLPRPSPSFAYPIALGSNASRDLLTDKLLGRFLDEMARRNADQQQQRANDGRCADDLHRLALRLDAGDGVQQRPGADEIDTFDADHVDDDYVAPMREVGECADLRRVGAGHDARANERFRFAAHWNRRFGAAVDSNR